MIRREFITLLGGAAATWPPVARAQQPAMPLVGYLNIVSDLIGEQVLAAFRRGLSEGGFDEGRNVIFEYPNAGGQIERLPILAQELIRRRSMLLPPWAVQTQPTLSIDYQGGQSKPAKKKPRARRGQGTKQRVFEVHQA
jgi:hypothetical protein